MAKEIKPMGISATITEVELKDLQELEALPEHKESRAEYIRRVVNKQVQLDLKKLRKS